MEHSVPEMANAGRRNLPPRPYAQIAWDLRDSAPSRRPENLCVSIRQDVPVSGWPPQGQAAPPRLTGETTGRQAGFGGV